MWAASGRIAPLWSIPSAARRPSRRCPSLSAASRHPCAASPTTTTGPRPSVAPFCLMPRPISSSTATPSGRWWKWPTASPRGRPSTPCRIFAAPPSSSKEPLPGWKGVDSSKLDQIGRIDPIPNPYMEGRPARMMQLKRHPPRRRPNPCWCSRPSPSRGS